MDDIFGIANSTVEELQRFNFSFSTFHPALEYTVHDVLLIMYVDQP